MSKPSLKDILSAVHARNVFNLLGKSVIVVRENGIESVYLLKELTDGQETGWWQTQPIGVDGVDFVRVISRMEVHRLDALMCGELLDGMDIVMRFDNNETLVNGIANLSIGTEEDPHKAYFEMLNKVGSRYKGAVEHLHEVLERIGSIDDSALSLYSDEYRNAIREFNESHEAFKSLATHVAQLEFTK